MCVFCMVRSFFFDVKTSWYRRDHIKTFNLIAPFAAVVAIMAAWSWQLVDECDAHNHRKILFSKLGIIRN